MAIQRFNVSKLVKDVLGDTFLEMGFQRKNNLWYKIVNNEVILLFSAFSYQSAIITRFFIQPLSYPIMIGDCHEVYGNWFEMNIMYFWKYNGIYKKNDERYYSSLFNHMSEYDRAKDAIKTLFDDVVKPAFTDVYDLNSAYNELDNYMNIIKSTVFNKNPNGVTSSTNITIYMLLELSRYEEAKEYIIKAKDFYMDWFEYQLAGNTITKEQYHQQVKKLYYNLTFLIDVIDKKEFNRVDEFLKSGYDKTRDEVFNCLKIQLPEWKNRH